MARQKTILVKNVTREQAESAFEAYNKNVSSLMTLEGEMNKKITVIKSEYDGRVGDLQARRDEAFKVLEVYATEHPELFEKKKSQQWTHGSFGFRTGMPKLKPRKGLTWSKVLTLCEGFFPSYVRKTPEIDKERILADREVLKDKLWDMGVEVAQDESFYIEPDLVEVATA